MNIKVLIEAYNHWEKNNPHAFEADTLPRKNANYYLSNRLKRCFEEAYEAGYKAAKLEAAKKMVDIFWD